MTPAPFPALDGTEHCHGEPTALFFPHSGGSPAEAKAVCAGCPFLAACFAYAYDRPSVWGVWGGTTYGERARLRRAVRRAA